MPPLPVRFADASIQRPADKPRLGDCIPGYGQTGPYRQAAGYDVVIEGEAGLMHM